LKVLALQAGKKCMPVIIAHEYTMLSDCAGLQVHAVGVLRGLKQQSNGATAIVSAEKHIFISHVAIFWLPDEQLFSDYPVQLYCLRLLALSPRKHKVLSGMEGQLPLEFFSFHHYLYCFHA